MAASSDSEDESFVELGKPVPFIEEEGKKKPISLQDAPHSSQDSKGRPRFHGAFTGGFSAGFFNTVGSKEGWTPSTFVSSRQKKEGRTTQRPEDFMDDDDLGEHGIAPRHFATSDAFSSEEQSRKRRAEVMLSTRDTILPASASLADLVVPEKLPIGIKLLRKMGWKEGQGVGPRVKKKRKKKKESKGDPVVKVYGCSRPPASDEESESFTEMNRGLKMMDSMQKTDFDIGQSEVSDIDLQNVTFAPKDVTPVCLTPKDNVHGLGYRGLDPSLALPGTHVSLIDQPAVRSSHSRKGIRGQAFGVGALEDDDEDIYTVDAMSNYDQTMELDDSEQLFGWTAPGVCSKGKGHPDKVRETPVSYVGKLLEGFMLSSKPLQPKKVFPAPSLPRGFQPFHRFKKTAEQLAQEAVGEKPAALGQRPGQSKLNAIERGMMLDEAPIATSVFDLIPKEDQQKMKAVKEAAKMTASRFHVAGTTTESNNNAAMKQTLPPSNALPDDTEKTASMTGDSAGPTTLFSGSMSDVQPFRKDPAKQGRYNRYLALLKKGVKDPYEDIVTRQMTEWERHREREEFSKAAKIYRPLANMMASRFTRGSFIDDSDQQSGLMEVAAEKSEQAKAAEMKMYGQLTREDMEWHPDNLLCKRFNIPNPYPESDIVGVPGLKRDKFSVFTFLSVSTPNSSQQDHTKQEPVPQAPETTSSLTRELNASKRKKGALSIFSVLEDDKDPPKSLPPSTTTKPDEEEKKTNDEIRKDDDKEDEDNNSDDDGEGKVDKPLDLFKAIFKNSDSESSSDSDKSDAEKKDYSDSVENKREKESDQEQSSETVSLPAVSLPFLRPEPAATLQLFDQQPAIENYPSSSSPPTAPIQSSKSPESRPKKRSRWGGSVSIFDVLDQSAAASSPQRERTDVEVEHRLSVPDSREASSEEVAKEYGPALPPPSTTVSGTVSATSITDVCAELTSDSHRKHKHKHRDQDHSSSKHRHKKEKKKKSKHKKKKKKKTKQSHNVKHKNHSSGSEADSETDSDT